MASRSEFLRERVRLVARELLHGRRQGRACAVVQAEEAFDAEAEFVREVERADEQRPRSSAKKWPLRWTGHAGMAAQQHSATKATRRAWLKTRKRRCRK